MEDYEKKKKVLFISSTGGHLTELLQLEPVFEKYDSYIVTEKQINNMELKKKYPGRVFFLVSGTYTGFINKIKYPLIFLINIMMSFILFEKIKPECIVTTGAHNAVPMCYIAHALKKKVIFIETFAAVEQPTKAGKMVYKIADSFVVQWENMLEFYPRAKFGGWIF